MHAVLTISEDHEIVPVAVGLDEHDALELAAKHIMQTLDPSWPDIVTVFEAGVYEQVVTLWNQNRYTLPKVVEYQVVDLSAAMEEFAARVDRAGR
ncbi:MAG: hypothetical protein WD314_13310 [Trueperaceae bacterium]